MRRNEINEKTLPANRGDYAERRYRLRSPRLSMESSDSSWRTTLVYKRIIVAVAGALFALLALLAAIITDLYDRDFPQAIGVESRFSLNFSESDFSITEAFAKLEELDTRWDLGLVKVAPDLASDGDDQIFVALNDGNLPAEFTWFGGEGVGKIVGKDRLATSYPDGFYLVTGEKAHLGEFEDTLKSAGVEVGRGDASIFDSLGFVIQERGFAAAVLSAFALIVALALFWLSLRARGRALRVLGGCPTVRIQVQDLAGFGGVLLVSAARRSAGCSGFMWVCFMAGCTSVPTSRRWSVCRSPLLLYPCSLRLSCQPLLGLALPCSPRDNRR